MAIAVFPILLLAGLVFLGLVVGVVLLLASPKTRVAGAVLGVILLMLLALGVVGVGALFFARGVAIEHRAREVEQQARAARLAEYQEAIGEVAPSEAVPIPLNAETSEKSSADDADLPDTEPDETSPAATDEPPADEATTASADEAPAGEAAEPIEPTSKPAWVGQPARRADDGYEMSLLVGPYSTRLECESHLPAALDAAADEYAQAYFGPEWAGRVRLPDTVLAERVVEQWEETIQASFGPMVQLHVLVRFDDKFNGMLKNARREAVVRRRLWIAGSGMAGALALLSLTYAGLRIGEARRADGRK